MPEYDYNPVVWVSLATASGMSLISLGQPGLRSDLDEQVYTGGLTAVQAMIGGEVGGDTGRFVGGSHYNKTGRFLVKSENLELVGQFLLISESRQTVAPELVQYYEELVSRFARETLKTEEFKKTQDFYVTLGVDEILETFFKVINEARKQVSIPTSEEPFKNAVQEMLNKSINDYEYSTTLVSISELKGNYPALKDEIRAKQSSLTEDFTNDLLELLTSERPHALVQYPKISTKKIRKELSKYVHETIEQLNVQAGLEETLQEFEKNELRDILEEFSLQEVSKANLAARLEEEVLQKFLREFPLLYLADPSIANFAQVIEDLNNRISEEFDLGGTLTRIVNLLFDNTREKEQEMVIPYIRYFSEQFTTGLTTSAWKYIQFIFKLISMETGVELENVLPLIKDEIPESHYTEVTKQVTRYKLSKVIPISFTVKKASDVLPFYRSLFAGLGFAVNTLITETALGRNTADNYMVRTLKNYDNFLYDLLKLGFLVSAYTSLEGERSKFDFTLAYPNIGNFDGNFDLTNLDVDTLVSAISRASVEYIDEEKQLIEGRLEELRKGFDKRAKDIERFLGKSPKVISKGYSGTEIGEVNVLFDKNNLVAPPIESIFQDIKDDYRKIIQKMESSLDKVASAASEFLADKISEKKFQNEASDFGFINQARDGVQKVIQKQWGNIERKYSSLGSSVEKRVHGLRKSLQKAYSQAGQPAAYLRFDQKSYSRGNMDIFKSHSSITANIESTIEKRMKKESIITFDNLGAYEFFANSRSLPRSLQIALTNALVNKESFPFLKDATSNLNLEIHNDIFQSYAEVIGQRTNEILTQLLQDVGASIRKEYFSSDPVITFFESGNKILVPAIDLGVVSERAMKSLTNLLGERIGIESQHEEDHSLHRILAAIPTFGCNYSDLVWERHHHGKEITLNKVMLLVNWHSLLEENKFYLNIIRYSAAIYSDRVKKGVEKTLIQVERSLTSG
ncbi:MAG: hypothetical protein ACFFFG_06310 [Candidatus Thorarchaeota archaeon]